MVRSDLTLRRLPDSVSAAHQELRHAEKSAEAERLKAALERLG